MIFLKKLHKPRAFLAIAIIFFEVLPSSIQGQVSAEKNVMPSDSIQWGKLQPEALSSKGKWVSYYLTYESGTDTLFVKATGSDKLYSFPGGFGGKFNADSFFMYSIKENRMGLINLNNGKHVVFQNVQSSEFSSDGKVVVTYGKLNGKDNALQVYSKDGKALDTITQVTNYKWNDERTAVLYGRQSGSTSTMSIIEFGKNNSRTHVLEVTGQDFSNFTWSKNGTYVAFYSETKQNATDGSLYFYNIKQQKLYTLKNSDFKLPPNMVTGSDTPWPLVISNDGSKIFFGLRSAKKTAVVQDTIVEIWNGNAKMLYGEQQAMKQDYHYNLGIWWPSGGKVRQITNEDFQFVMLAGAQKYALIGSGTNYEPQYTGVPDMDFYIIDLESGFTKTFLKQQSSSTSQIRTSPDGKYIFYYKNSNWWSYNVALGTHDCVTCGTEALWDRTENDPANQFEVYGLGGFSENSEVLLYDQYDIWIFSPNGKSYRRVTNGKKENIQYRIVPQKEWHLPYNFSGVGLELINLKENVWINTLNLKTGITGFSKYNITNSLRPATRDTASAGKLLISPQSGSFVYTEQRFDLPSRLIFDNGSAKPVVIMQSNEHYSKYSWGSSRLFPFTIPSGRSLGAALFYPSNYDSAKSYPMVVYIYDNVSRNVHNFVYPTLSNPYGFNIANLTTNGYFVLLPDIAYKPGMTGLSAVECVEAAVKTASSMVNIDPHSIGLFGHSFGGFETNFIIGHSNIFAAAISGSGVADVVKAYLSVHAADNKADLWRYEKQQYRIGSTLYRSMDSYLENSPVLSAAKVETPLLLFAGKKDNNVMYEQSMELYLALRRLKKQTVFLLYPDEGHVMVSRDAQSDLTKRVQAWFDYFLKKDLSSEWITIGIKQ